MDDIAGLIGHWQSGISTVLLQITAVLVAIIFVVLISFMAGSSPAVHVFIFSIIIVCFVTVVAKPEYVMSFKAFTVAEIRGGTDGPEAHWK
ncbi:MAG: hypothetical protein ACYCX4_03615 [Bacillota bacterium]